MTEDKKALQIDFHSAATPQFDKNQRKHRHGLLDGAGYLMTHGLRALRAEGARRINAAYLAAQAP